MILTGPFDSVTDYIGDLHVVLTTASPVFEIEINESDLYKYKFIRYLFKQDLKISHNECIVNYVKINGIYSVLPMKPNSQQTFEYIEERIRLSQTQLTGQSGLTIGFKLNYGEQSHLFIKELMFGQINTDDVDFTNGITLACSGPGAISPSPGFNPVIANVPLTVKLYPFIGCVVNKIKCFGTLYNAEGVQLPKYLPTTVSEFDVKLATVFDNGAITIEFRRI